MNQMIVVVLHRHLKGTRVIAIAMWRGEAGICFFLSIFGVGPPSEVMAALSAQAFVLRPPNLKKRLSLMAR